MLQVYFGKHMICKDGIEGSGKMIKVGDPISVLKKVSSVAEAAV